MPSLKNEKRIFDNPVLESLSRTNAYVVIITYVIISFGNFIYGAIRSDLFLIAEISLFFAGLLFFSLAEYLIHRYLFHSLKKKGKSNWSQFLHKIHHDHPNDKKRLALPLPAGLLLAAIFYFVFWLIMGGVAPFFFSGFLLGYALYLWVHYLIHTKRPPKNGLRILWSHHHIHHYQDDSRAFGVTSTLWDIVFGTMPKMNRS